MNFRKSLIPFRPNSNKNFKLTMMEKIAKRSPFAGVPAWALSLMTLFPLFILLVILEDPKNPELSTFQIIGYIFCTIMITLACFFICRIHPKSVWYTPVICNVVAIMAIIVYVFTDLSTSSEFIGWLSCFVISTTGAIVGSIIGRRKTKPA